MKPAAGEDTDLGALGLIKRRAADGRADKYGTQGCATTVMAGTICNPGCPRLENTQAGSEDFWPDGQHSLKARTTQDQALLVIHNQVLVWGPRRTLVLGS